MDVTNENFLELLPEIRETIKGCDFIAIDTELSGLLRDRNSNRFDLPDERFAKMVRSCSGYFIMQFGLSCFKRNSDPFKYNNRTYNFYIFPQAHSECGDIDRTFSIQSHAIQFLSENGFDFNKLFKHGVSYLTFNEKKELMSQLKSEMCSSNISSGNSNKRKSGQHKEPSIKTKESIAAAKGFLEVLEEIIATRKPIVGHNLLIDLIQVINQFVEIVDDSYSSFKETCNSLFPNIYDTKFIAHNIFDAETLTDNQSRLNDLYCQLKDWKTKPKLEVVHLSKFADENQLPHQAGYDAYMSGYCFITMCHLFLEEQRNPKNRKDDPNAEPTSVALEQQIMANFANKIHLSYSYDHKHFHLGGSEQNPDRGHVFYMTFPPTWTQDDLFQAFKDCGGITYGRINKTSALCALRDRKYIDSVMQLVKKMEKGEINSNYKIYTYDTYLKLYKDAI